MMYIKIAGYEIAEIRLRLNGGCLIYRHFMQAGTQVQAQRGVSRSGEKYAGAGGRVKDIVSYAQSAGAGDFSVSAVHGALFLR